MENELMETAILFLVFLVGLLMGSFLNVLIWRLNSEDPSVPKFWQGRSICPWCRAQIKWSDNIPLLSFVLLSGRCRYCHKRISWQYPLVELLTAVVTVGVWYFSGNVSPIVKLLDCSIAYTFIVIFFSDWVYGLIPDEMIIFGCIAAFIFQFSFFNFHFWEHLLVGIFSGLVFLLIVVLTRFKGMGLGDVKLAFLIGLVLGWPAAVIGFWAAFLMGGAAALALVLLKKVRLSDKMALGPYLVLGTLFAALWSKELLRLAGL